MLPYYASPNIASLPLEIFFTDIWGPTPVNSTSGYKYYIHFLDDYSKFTWFYPIKSHYKALEIFVRFRKHVENVCATRIKFPHSDGASEFTSKGFQSELCANGIGH